MERESDSIRIARIEEGMVLIHHKIAANAELSKVRHVEVMTALKPVLKHDTDITILKRDRFWVFTMVGTAVTMALYAIADKLGIRIS